MFLLETKTEDNGGGLITVLLSLLQSLQRRIEVGFTNSSTMTGLLTFSTQTSASEWRVVLTLFLRVTIVFAT